MNKAVLALDLGTSSCKGALYTANGERLSISATEYPVSRPIANVVEQNPQHYVEAALAVVRDLAKNATALDHAIATIGLSTQTPTLVLCDQSGAAIAPAILWQDTRADKEQIWLLDNTTGEQRRKWFGLDLDIGAASLLPKLLWMREHEPSVWHATRWVLQPKDYVTYALTGRFVTDRWCALGFAHVDTGKVDPEILAILGKKLSPCPPVSSAHTVAGEVVPEAASRCHIPVGTAVIVGLDDGMAGILATGALHNENRAAL